MTDAFAVCANEFGNRTVSTSEVMNFAAARGLKIGTTPLKPFRVRHGYYNFSTYENAIERLMNPTPRQEVVELSDEEIYNNIKSRFNTLEKMSIAASRSIVRSMIVSGPGGLGKTYTIEKVIGALPEERRAMVSGHVTATGLYSLLYTYRHRNCVVVLDDADSVFADEVTLNVLKKACDTTDRRVISWLSKAEITDADGEVLPSSFEFEATIIFITNKCLDSEAVRSPKLAPHFNALISRSHYVELGIKTPRDYMIRIKQVVYEYGMLDHLGSQVRDEIVEFIEQNRDRMRELSLRMALKIADLVQIDPINWREDARTTCMRP